MSENSVVAVNPEVVPQSPNMSVFLDTNMFNQLYRAAKLFASSDLVPSSYKGKEANCFIALELSSRMGVPAFAVMQNVGVINGKPGIEAKLIIAMINNSGRFVDPIEFEVFGNDPSWDKKNGKAVDPNYKVRAFATRKNGKTLYGEWITWDMVIAEGWVQKNGSKWQTMPGIMFSYRAASFFGKLYCPDLLFGMQTTEELHDITSYSEPSSPKLNNAADIINQFNASVAKPEPAEEPVPGEEPITEAEKKEAEDGNSILQECYQLIAKLAEVKGESPDYVIDSLTNNRVGCQIELEDKPIPYLTDIKMMLENELAKEA